MARKMKQEGVREVEKVRGRGSWGDKGVRKLQHGGSSEATKRVSDQTRLKRGARGVG